MEHSREKSTKKHNSKLSNGNLWRAAKAERLSLRESFFFAAAAAADFNETVVPKRAKNNDAVSGDCIVGS